MNPWIAWTSQLKAISQIGTAYSRDAYDLERYQQLSRIAHEMLWRHHCGQESTVNCD